MKNDKPSLVVFFCPAAALRSHRDRTRQRTRPLASCGRHAGVDESPQLVNNPAPDDAPVAQLDRVPGYEPGGREFESLRAHQSEQERQASACRFFCLRDGGTAHPPAARSHSLPFKTTEPHAHRHIASCARSCAAPHRLTRRPGAPLAARLQPRPGPPPPPRSRPRATPPGRRATAIRRRSRAGAAAWPAPRPRPRSDRRSR